MDDALISIIVPIYNAEKYISKCIKSIIGQTYKNLEIILVDDGSNDGTGRICDQFARKDKRIKVIHNKNMGVSASRNIGIDHANGSFLMFADSDDWISKDAIECLYSLQRTNDADICVGGVERIAIKNFTYLSMSENRCSKDETDKFLRFINELSFVSVAKLYKTEIIKNKISFDKEIKSNEDVLFVLNYLGACKTFISTSRIIYFYNGLNDNSATKKSYNDFNIWMLKCAEAYKNIFADDNREIIKENINFFYMRRWYCGVLHYAVFFDNEDEAILKIQETCNMFKDHIDLNMELPETTMTYVKDILFKYMPQENYQGLYKEFNPVIKEGFIKKFRHLIGNIIIGLKKIRYWGLK